MNHDVDIGIVDYRESIVADLDLIQPFQALGVEFARRGVRHHDLTTGPAGNFRGISHQHIEGSAPHGAKAKQADFDRIQDSLPTHFIAGSHHRKDEANPKF